MNATELQILKTELALPLYAPTLSDHVATANLINTTAASVPDSSEKPTWRLFECPTIAEMNTVLAVPIKAALWNSMLSLGVINPDSPRLKQAIIEIFGQPSPALTAFNKFARRSGSRSEELGLGRVTESDVADALRS